MKNLFFGFTLFILYCCASASTPSNEFCFNYGSGVSSVTLEYNGIFKDSKPFGEVTYSSSSKKSCISVKSDRDNTTAVADNFNQLVNSNENKFVLLKIYGNRVPAFPEKLHFYMGVNTSINGHPLTNNLYLAQGHYSSGNNWWVASNSGFYQTCGFIGMTLTDSANNQYCISTTGNLHEVFITAGKCLYNPYECTTQ